MAEFASTCLIGVPRAEIVLLDAVTDGWETLSVDLGEKSSKIENAIGQVFKRWDAADIPKCSITIRAATLGLVEQLESLKAYTLGPLSFIPFGARNRYSIPLLTNDTTHVTLPANPWTALGTLYKAAGGSDTAIVIPIGVFAGYKADGSQATTNFYTSGSYAAATRIVTLGSSPGATGTRVYVNLTFSGIAIWIDSLRVKPIPGSGTYDVTLELSPAHPGP